MTKEQLEKERDQLIDDISNIHEEINTFEDQKRNNPDKSTIIEHCDNEINNLNKEKRNCHDKLQTIYNKLDSGDFD